MKQLNRHGLASFLVFFSLGIILSGHEAVYGGWLDFGKKKEEAPKPKAMTPASKNAVKLPAPTPKRSPNEIKAFNEKMQKGRKAFEEKFKALPAGPREMAVREFDAKTRADRAALEQELKTYPLDEKESAQREFGLKIQKEQREFYEKLKGMPPGKKEIARAEFEKKLQEERKALNQKINSMSPDPKDTARREFEENARKEAQEFYQGK